MNMIKKIIKPDQFHLTRLHTETGDWCGWAALPGIIPAVRTWLRARLRGKYALKPWWVWPAIEFVERNLKPTDRVLEVGSGFSTLWLAQRCREVVSFEESPYWKALVEQEANRLAVSNLTIVHEDSWIAFHRLLSTAVWDVVVIDGSQQRFEMFHHLLEQDAPPRLIVYDNTDRQEARPAFKLRLSDYKVHVFRGFGPQTLITWETTVFMRNAVDGQGN